MKITVLDGYAANPGDLSWDGISQFGELTVYDRTPDELIIEHIADNDIVIDIEPAVLDDDIATGLDVDSVIVVQERLDIQVPYANAVTIQQMDHPERGVPYGESVQAHVAALPQTDELRTQIRILQPCHVASAKRNVLLTPFVQRTLGLRLAFRDGPPPFPSEHDRRKDTLSSNRDIRRPLGEDEAPSALRRCVVRDVRAREQHCAIGQLKRHIALQHERLHLMHSRRDDDSSADLSNLRQLSRQVKLLPYRIVKLHIALPATQRYRRATDRAIFFPDGNDDHLTKREPKSKPQPSF